MRTPAPHLIAAALLYLGASWVFAQAGADGDKAAQALEAQSQSDAESAFFGDEGAMAETQESSRQSGLDQFLTNDQGVKWAGSIKTDFGWNGGWMGSDQLPDLSDPARNWRDCFTGDLEGKFALDARPAKEYRAKMALTTSWPFAGAAAPATAPGPGSPSTVSVPNIKVWELFGDVNIDDEVFVRIGKQVTSWGLLGSAYSPTDVISLSPKDVTDLEAEREGPVAIKVSVPASAWNAAFSGLVMARDEWLSSSPTWRDLGYAAKGEFLIKYTEVSIGGFYRQSLAPKLVGTLTSGLGYIPLPFVRDINIFSESALSWGSDRELGSGTSASGTFSTLSKPDSSLYYQGTLGASYSNSELNSTFSVEYFYNGLGSNEGDYAARAYRSLFVATGDGKLLTLGDALHPGMHNLTALLSFTEIGGSKFGSTTIWQQNLSDGSGWVREKLSYAPWKYVSFYAGCDLVYGATGSEFPTLFQDPASGLAKRLSFFVGTTTATGNF
jgi:hypothetical protein